MSSQYLWALSFLPSTVLSLHTRRSSDFGELIGAGRTNLLSALQARQLIICVAGQSKRMTKRHSQSGTYPTRHLNSREGSLDHLLNLI